MNLREDLKLLIYNAVKKQFGLEKNIEIIYPREQKYGDYSSNVALILSRIIKKTPDKVAEDIVKNIEYPAIEKIEIINGFINFFISDNWLLKNLKETFRKDFGAQNFGNGKKAIVEFVSANPTGPLTIPNARAAALGDALVRLMNYTGYRADAEFYVNDGGRQVELLGLSIIERMKELEGENFSIPEGGYHGEYVREIARDFLREGKKDRPLPEIKKMAVEKILSFQKETLKKYGVEFNR